MHSERYTEVAEGLIAEAHAIEVSKRPGYTGGSPDVLANFKRIAERTGLTPEQVWAVYFLKHVDAITTAMTQPTLPVSEALLGRFADAINYLKLGWGLMVERANTQAAYPQPFAATQKGLAPVAAVDTPQAAKINWREKA